MDWLKIHHDARTDKKLSKLTDGQFRVWFNLLLLASEQNRNRGTITDIDIDMLALEVANDDVDLLESTLSSLEHFKMITRDEHEITFVRFSERQYGKPSNYPSEVKERVHKHRDNVKNRQVETAGETPTDTNVTPRNADVTRCIAVEQNRTEQNREEKTRTEQTRTEQSACADDHVAVVFELRSFSISEKICLELAEGFSAEQIRQQIRWLPQRNPKNAAPTLIQAIRENWAAPAAAEPPPPPKLTMTRVETRPPPDTAGAEALENLSLEDRQSVETLAKEMILSQEFWRAKHAKADDKQNFWSQNGTAQMLKATVARIAVDRTKPGVMAETMH